MMIFDDPDYDPFDKEKREWTQGCDFKEESIETLANLQLNSTDDNFKPMILIFGAFEDTFWRSPEESESESSESVAVSVDEALDNEDIEALFDD